MNRDSISQMATILLLAGVCQVVTAAPANSPKPPSTAASGPKTAPDNLSPYVVVEDTWVYLIDEPDIYFDRARDELALGETKHASDNVRKAAAMIEAESKRGSGADRARLVRDAKALLRVAGEIDSGKITAPNQLDSAFALARMNLAVHHDIKATEAWVKKDTQAAGRSLAAAARYVQGAMHTLDNATATRWHDGLRSVEQFGSRLGHESASAVDGDWKQARNTLGHALEALGKKIETH